MPTPARPPTIPPAMAPAFEPPPLEWLELFVGRLTVLDPVLLEPVEVGDSTPVDSGWSEKMC